MSADVEMQSAIIGHAEGTAYRGQAGLRQWLRDTFETFEEVRLEADEFLDLGDRVLAFGRIVARGRGSGVGVDSPTGWVISVGDGRIERMEGFLSRAEALRAAGLGD